MGLNNCFAEDVSKEVVKKFESALPLPLR